MNPYKSNIQIYIYLDRILYNSAPNSVQVDGRLARAFDRIKVLMIGV